MTFRKEFLIAVILVLIAIVPQMSFAQFSIGASYEIRNEEPKNGFGVRIERAILQKLPIVNLDLRAHFSYFSEDNYVGRDDVSYGEITNYDYGLAAVGGVSVGLLEPYIGVGLGSTTTDITELQEASLPEDGKESDLFWNGFLGAKISPILFLKPFVEYRVQASGSFDDLNNAAKRSGGRFIFGVMLAF